MSIFDDIPLPAGTQTPYGEVQSYDLATEKYTMTNGDQFPRKKVDEPHADMQCQGVVTRYQSPGNAYNTRFFRRNFNK